MAMTSMIIILFTIYRAFCVVSAYDYMNNVAARQIPEVSLLRHKRKSRYITNVLRSQVLSPAKQTPLLED